MDILAMTEGVNEAFIAGNACHDAQFNLGIITAHEEVIPFAGYKHPAYLLAYFRPGRDVLQIWIRTGKPSGHGRHLIEWVWMRPVLGLMRGWSATKYVDKSFDSVRYSMMVSMMGCSPCSCSRTLTSVE